jgi:hypothetical protein
MFLCPFIFLIDSYLWVTRGCGGRYQTFCNNYQITHAVTGKKLKNRLSGIVGIILSAIIGIPLFSFSVQSQSKFSELSRITRDLQLLKRKTRGASERYRCIIAPRLILERDWIASLRERKSNPRWIYQPAPQTWDYWYKTWRTQVEPAAKRGVPLKESDLVAWNSSLLTGDNHAFSASDAYEQVAHKGHNLYLEDRLTIEQLKNIESFRLSFDLSQALSFEPTLCLNSLAPETFTWRFTGDCIKHVVDSFRFNSSYHHNIRQQWILSWQNREIPYECYQRPTLEQFEQNKLEGKICGFVHYINFKHTRALTLRLVDRINSYFDHGAKDIDPLTFGLISQRDFIAIHPFKDGNGRVSRFLLDYILVRSGLPAVSVPDMNRDLAQPLDIYQVQIIESFRKQLHKSNLCYQQHRSASQTQRHALILSECKIFKRNHLTSLKQL